MSPNDRALADWFATQSDWSDRVLPCYSGACVGNVASSVIAALSDVPLPADERLLPPLSADLLDPEVLSGARVVICIVLDGYGSRLSRDGDGLRAGALTGLRIATTVTSVFPSTTAAALTSLQTGASPGAHGIAGYTLYLPGARRVMNMIQLTAVDGSSVPSRIADATTLLPIPTIYQRLDAVGVEAVVVSHHEYARSPLTILHSGETPYRGHRTAAEFAGLLRREAERPGRRFIFGYWAGVDMLSHSYGPASDEVVLETALVERALLDGLLRPLANAGENVAVLLTADHGLVSLNEQQAESMGSLAKFAGKFRTPPAGERRAAGLFTTGQEQRTALAQAVGASGVVLDTESAIAAGLYGPAPLHPELLQRVGDTLVLARGGHSFPFRPIGESGRFSPGAHGSLTAEEMLAPLLVWRFGG